MRCRGVPGHPPRSPVHSSSLWRRHLGPPPLALFHVHKRLLCEACAPRRAGAVTTAVSGNGSLGLATRCCPVSGLTPTGSPCLPVESRRFTAGPHTLVVGAAGPAGGGERAGTAREQGPGLSLGNAAALRQPRGTAAWFPATSPSM